MRPGQRLELTIEKLSIGGRGIARFEGAVVFVPAAAPQERALVEIIAAKKNFAEGEIVAILEPSPHRIDPPCQHARSGACGGCGWQHVAYEEQLRQKRVFIEESLRKLSGFEQAIAAPVVPSPNEFRYRNRIQIHRGPNGKLGFKGRRSAQVVDVKDCLIAEEPLIEALAQTRLAIQDGSFRPPARFELRLSPSGRVRRERARGPGEADPEAGFDSTFSQVNSAQNESLVRYVVDRFGERGGFEEIYDVYSGDGNFSLPLARALPAARIEAVELDREACERGRRRAREEGLEGRLRFVEKAAEDWAEDRARNAKRAWARSSAFAGALLDPPRTGCAPAAIDAIANGPFSFAVYVSCHPATLSRDLRAFRINGWELLSAQPFDMFPQTDHVEVVACLERKS